MKLLILDWGSYTQQDITDVLRKNGVCLKVVNYYFGNKNEDDFFEHRFYRFLKEDRYDGVFSVNYFPVIASVCHTFGIKYLSWSYDSPLNVLRIEETLGYETNSVFLFDKAQAAEFCSMGFNNVYHLPLGIRPERLGRIQLSREEEKRFGSDISFVGNMYPSPLSDLMSPLNEYTKGYLNALNESQFLIYGYYYIEELLTDKLLAKINCQYRDKIPGFSLSREQLSYAMSSHITGRERLALLKILSRRFPLKLYSGEKPDLLGDVVYMGTAGYYTDMPKIFKASRINLNITLKILKTGIPLRALDILGSGGLLFSNYQEELAENFIDGEEYVQYDSLPDALEKAEYYLRNEEIRRQIAERGCRKAAEEFKYDKRLSSMFDAAGLL